MADLRLTDLTQATGVTINDLMHIVITGDTTQYSGGSSYKATINQVFDSLSGYCISDLYASNIHSCSPLNINPLDEGNVYFGSTSGITLDLPNKRIGINTSSPQYTLDIKGSQSNLYYDPTSVGGRILLSGNTNVPRIGVAISPYLTKPVAGFDLGMRAWDDATYPGYGKVGDAFFYAGNETNGFNFLNPPGTGTEDYIRFYAGQTANGTIPDMHIQGSGSTRGYVGIGTITPTSKLHVSGNTKIDGDLITNTISATTYYNLPIYTGNTSATCITDLYVNNLNSCSPLHIQPVNNGNVFISENGGTVGIGTTTVDVVAPETFTVSAKSTTSYNIITAKSNVNNYTQLNITNKNFGLNSSADVVATNNTGNETTNFIDMGINGSNFAGTIGVGSDAYLYSTGRELYIGNASTGSTGNLRLFAGNAGSSTQMFISGTTGNVGIGTNLPTQRLHVSGNTKIDGGLTANTISATTYQNLPTDVRVTGGTYSNGTAIFTNNTGGTFNVTGLYTGGTDVRVTGATYSNNTFTYTNNTGGTFNVFFNTMTGLTINGGGLTVTGNTLLQSTTASTLNISTTPTTDTGTTANYLTRDGVTGQVKVKTIPGPTVYGLFAQTGNSVAVSATTVEGSLIDGGIGTLTVPANGFSIGDSFRADFGGVMSAKNNDTLRIRVKTGSVILADSGVQTMTTTTNDVWQLSVNFTIRKLGTAGNASIVSLGVFHSEKQANGTPSGFAFNTVNSTTFDTTINNTLEITAQWSTNSALNSIYSDIFILNKIY